MAESKLSIYLDWFSEELRKFRTETDPKFRLMWLKQAKITLGIIELNLEKEILLAESASKGKEKT